MSFAPGDEVVCVDDSYHPASVGGCHVNDEMQAERGKHYVVRWSGRVEHPSYREPYDGVRLVGIVRGSSCRGSRVVVEDTPFHAARFRPVKRESIEIFKAMCTSTKPLVEV